MNVEINSQGEAQPTTLKWVKTTTGLLYRLTQMNDAEAAPHKMLSVIEFEHWANTGCPPTASAVEQLIINHR